MYKCSTQGEARTSLLNELSLSRFYHLLIPNDLSTQQWADLKELFNLLSKIFMNENKNARRGRRNAVEARCHEATTRRIFKKR